MLTQRKSIFIISVILLINSMSIVAVYFLILGETSASFVAELIGKEAEDDFWVSRAFYITIIALIMLPVVCKKDLQEMRLVTFTLFVAVTIFIAILLIQLAVFGRSEFAEPNERLSITELAGPYKNTTF